MYYTLDTYDYEAMDDGSVSVRDKVTGECYYVFEAPYVYDAENAEIPATVVLTPVSDGVRMHYELDGEALAQAAFPVTIDPLIRSANANKYTEFTCLADGQGLPYSQAQDHIKTVSYTHLDVYKRQFGQSAPTLGEFTIRSR